MFNSELDYCDNIMDFIKKLYRTGLTENDEGIIVIRTLLVNLIVLVSNPMLLYRAIVYLNNGMFLHGLVILFMILLLFFILGLNHLRKFELAKRLVIPATCAFLFYCLLAFGQEEQIHLFLLIVLIFVFILFEKTKDQFIQVFIVFSSYIIPYIYLVKRGPLFSMDIPHNGFINVILALVAATILSLAIGKKIKGYIIESKIAIRALEEKNAFIAMQKEELELFTSMASHDLKTPIRTINSFIGLIEIKNTIHDPQTLEYLNYAKSGAEQLSHLVNGISAFKRVEDYELDPKGVNIEQCIQRAINNVNPTGKSDIQITFTQLSEVKMDENHLYHIIQNLIENALKYNESKIKKVKISTQKTRNTQLIRFEDNGIGIDPAYTNYIFEPFKKLNSTSKYNSTGLGLAICKKILRLYKGNITVQSNPLGGSIFSIEIPESLIKS